MRLAGYSATIVIPEPPSLGIPLDDSYLKPAELCGGSFEFGAHALKLVATGGHQFLLVFNGVLLLPLKRLLVALLQCHLFQCSIVQLRLQPIACALL